MIYGDDIWYMVHKIALYITYYVLHTYIALN